MMIAGEILLILSIPLICSLFLYVINAGVQADPTCLIAHAHGLDDGLGKGR